jgi:hypothetical protein
MEAVFSVGSTPRLYNEDPRPAEIIIEGASRVGNRRLLRRNGNGLVELQERGYEDFMCAAVTVRLLSLLC